MSLTKIHIERARKRVSEDRGSRRLAGSVAPVSNSPKAPQRRYVGAILRHIEFAGGTFPSSCLALQAHAQQGGAGP